MNFPEVKEEDRMRSMKNLEQPMQVEDNGNEMKMNEGDVSLHIGKERLNDREAEELADFRARNMNQTVHAKNETLIRDLPNADQWRRADKFLVNNGREERDLTKIMPGMSKYKIFFCPDLPQEKHSVAVDDEHQNIYVMGNMTSMLDVIGLLHKIGHIWSKEGMKAMGDKIQSMDEPDNFIARENEATWFTEKMLKPFLSGEKGQDVKNVLYGNRQENVKIYEGKKGLQDNPQLPADTVEHPADLASQKV